MAHRCIEVGDELRADRALTLVRRGTALLYRGDYRNARQLLAAMKRRLARQKVPPGATPTETFHRHRAATAERARLLNRLLVELRPGYRLDLAHAPDVSEACHHVYEPGPALVPLAELLGVLGAHQWRVAGVHVPALDATIHPHYGVFSPTRQEYVDLVAAAPWPEPATAFDIGTGTGVLAALLVRRGAARVVATDIEPRAVECARANTKGVEVVLADLFPEGRADLVVCNPPWLPAEPASPLDAAVYDPDSRMLRRFLHGLPRHLTPGGEAWLVLSDLAERLELRTRADLTGMFDSAGLTVLGRTGTRPRPRRQKDSLSRYRDAEITSLWRLTTGAG